jgi:hypothetical protein
VASICRFSNQSRVILRVDAAFILATTQSRQHLHRSRASFRRTSQGIPFVLRGKKLPVFGKDFPFSERLVKQGGQSVLTGDQSRPLQVGDRVCWRAKTTDLGTVVDTTWNGVTIDWDDCQTTTIQHNDMKQVERVPVKLA